MTTPDITIPEETIEAVAREIYDTLEGPIANQDFGRQKRQWDLALKLARAACIAMLKNWPGMLDMTEGEPGRENREIILPLQKQEGGEKTPS